MIKSEEIRIAGAVLISFALMLGTVLRGPEIVPFLLLGAITLAVVTVAGMAWRRKRPEKPDERSARCSLVATRNAFITAIVMIGIYIALLNLTVSLTSTTDVLAIIWGVCVGVYLLTYLYLKNSILEKEA